MIRNDRDIFACKREGLGTRLSQRMKRVKRVRTADHVLAHAQSASFSMSLTGSAVVYLVQPAHSAAPYFHLY